MSLNKQINEIKSKRMGLIRQISPIQEEISLLYHEEEKLKEQREEEIISKINPKNPGKFWPWLLQENGYGGMAKYRFREKVLCDLFNRGTHGYYPSIHQVSLQVCLTYGSEQSYKQNLNMINVLLPFLKNAEDEYVCFHIFEHSLSANGSYTFLVDKKTRMCKIEKRYYTDKTFSSIEEGLKYIQENLWYDGKTEEDDEDYDD